jgi:hypothetical protein
MRGRPPKESAAADTRTRRCRMGRWVRPRDRDAACRVDRPLPARRLSRRTRFEESRRLRDCPAWSRSSASVRHWERSARKTRIDVVQTTGRGEGAARVVRNVVAAVGESSATVAARTRAGQNAVCYLARGRAEVTATCRTADVGCAVMKEGGEEHRDVEAPNSATENFCGHVTRRGVPVEGAVDDIEGEPAAIADCSTAENRAALGQ